MSHTSFLEAKIATFIASGFIIKKLQLYIVVKLQRYDSNSWWRKRELLLSCRSWLTHTVSLLHTAFKDVRHRAQELHKHRGGALRAQLLGERWWCRWGGNTCTQGVCSQNRFSKPHPLIQKCREVLEYCVCNANAMHGPQRVLHVDRVCNDVNSRQWWDGSKPACAADCRVNS